MKKVLPLNLLFLALASHMASGALIFKDLGTDGSGNFINPGTTGWSGTGTVVADAGYDTVSGNTMINDFTGSGNVLSLGAATGFGTTILDPTTATMTISLGGSGSGDIAINLGGPLVDGVRIAPMGFNVLDLQGGVTSVTVEINFSNPLAATFTEPVPRTNSPFLAAFRTQNTLTAADFTAEYLGIRHTTSLDGPFIGGLPAGLTAADSIEMSNSAFDWGSDPSFSGTSSNSNSAFEGVNLFDVDGSGGPYTTGVNNDGILQDAEQVYATGMRFTFTPGAGDADGLFDGANFLFSLNGTQYVDTFANSLTFVPEPSGAVLLSLGLCSVICRRRRKA